jgi:tetratricopeptide (TPR) repeat protein
VAVTAVAEAREDVLDRLLAQSILARRTGAGGRARIVMLEPVRELAAEHLDRRSDRALVRSRHAGHFAWWAEAGRDGIYGRDWTAWRDRLAEDVGNFRAALRWAIAAGDRATALRLAVASRKLWDLQWLTLEGFEWLNKAMAVAGEAPAELEARAALALSAYAVPGALTSEQAAAEARRAAERFRRMGDGPGEAESLLSLGHYIAAAGRRDEARRVADRALELAGDDARLRSMVMHLRVMSARRFEDAEATARAAVAAMHETGADLVHEGPILARAGAVALQAGRYAEALPLLEEAIALARRAGDAPRVALARGDQGLAALALGDAALATEAFREELDTCRRLGYFELLGEGALGLAALAADAGDVDRAARLAGAAQRRLAALGANLPLPLRRLVETCLEATRRDAPERWDRGARDGARLADHEVLALALGRLVEAPVTGRREGGAT